MIFPPKYIYIKSNSETHIVLACARELTGKILSTTFFEVLSVLAVGYHYKDKHSARALQLGKIAADKGASLC